MLDEEAVAVTEGDIVAVALGEELGAVHPVPVGLLFLPAVHRVQPISHKEPVAVPERL